MEETPVIEIKRNSVEVMEETTKKTSKPEIKVDGNMNWSTSTGSGIYQQVPSNIKNAPNLPVGTFFLRMNAITQQFFLEQTKDFILPEKIYGPCQSRVTRILKQYRTKAANLGVLLCGLKGTGKSLTAKLLCTQANLPVIIVDQDYTGFSNYKSFIMNISQEVVFFYDEFEKKFHPNIGQEQLLSLIEGIATNNYLYVFTANVISNVNQYYHNRPGRIRYSWSYVGLDEATIIDVVDDLLERKEHRDTLINIFMLINNGDMNFDRLVSFIEEVNIHGDTTAPSELIDGFNITADTSSRNWDMEIHFPFDDGDLVLEGEAAANFLHFDGEVIISGMFCRPIEDFLSNSLNAVTPMTKARLEAFILCYQFRYMTTEEDKDKARETLRQLNAEGIISEYETSRIQRPSYENYIECDWLDETAICTKCTSKEIVYELPNGYKFVFTPKLIRSFSSVKY